MGLPRRSGSRRGGVRARERCESGLRLCPAVGLVGAKNNKESMLMMRMQSRLQQFGIVTCGLSLGLFGCPQPGATVDDGADSGLPVAENAGGEDGAGTNNASGGSTNNAGGGGSGVIDRSVIVRPNSPTLFVADL